MAKICVHVSKEATLRTESVTPNNIICSAVLFTLFVGLLYASEAISSASEALSSESSSSLSAVGGS